MEGQEPTVFDPDNPPAIETSLGSVEDWIIENRSPETHVFHIHQLHFVQLEQNGAPVSSQAQQLMDEIIVPAWNGDPFQPFPSVKVRMDFRDPTALGLFVYHCHILGHEDGGMMAEIEVKNSTVSGGSSLTPSFFNPIFVGASTLLFNFYRRLFHR